jgi:hypothetical protein
MVQQIVTEEAHLLCKVFYDTGSERLGVEAVRVRSKEDIEETAEQFIVHGLDGDAIWPRAKVVFYKLQQERGEKRR